MPSTVKTAKETPDGTFVPTPAARRPSWFVGTASAVLGPHPVHDGMLRLWHGGEVFARLPLPATGDDPTAAATHALTAHGWTVDRWEQTGDEWTAYITAGDV